MSLTSRTLTYFSSFSGLRVESDLAREAAFALVPGFFRRVFFYNYTGFFFYNYFPAVQEKGFPGVV